MISTYYKPEMLISCDNRIDCLPKCQLFYVQYCWWNRWKLFFCLNSSVKDNFAQKKTKRHKWDNVRKPEFLKFDVNPGKNPNNSQRQWRQWSGIVACIDKSDMTNNESDKTVKDMNHNMAAKTQDQIFYPALFFFRLPHI